MSVPLYICIRRRGGFSGGLIPVYPANGVVFFEKRIDALPQIGLRLFDAQINTMAATSAETYGQPAMATTVRIIRACYDEHT